MDQNAQQVEEKDESEVESEPEIITIETPHGEVDLNVSSADEYKPSTVEMEMYGDNIPSFKSGVVARKAFEIGRKRFGLSRPALEGFDGFSTTAPSDNAPTDRQFSTKIVINGVNS